MSPRLVLVGPPGAGKSTIGRLVADRLAVALDETDVEVEAVAGMSVADIFVVDGEARFRDLEKAAVARALVECDGVLAVSGGAVLDADTRAALTGLPVVFLDVDLTDAVHRVGLARDRPILLGNPRAQLKALLDARRPLYEAVAAATVSTAGRTPEEVAAEVLAAMDAVPFEPTA